MPSRYEQHLARLAPQVIDEAVRIAEIPAPTFREQDRARDVERRFAEIGGWDHLERDRLGNVVAIRKGDPGGGRVLAAAHLDTVFPDAEIHIQRSRGRLAGPGIGDNSVSVAALLAIAEALRDAPPRGVGDILLAANVGEEGRGDLRGIRAICKQYAGQFDRVLAVEGHARDRVQTAFVGSNRYEIAVTTDGGHSWGAYGRPNAIQLLARAIAALEPHFPRVGIEPKTTMNVGIIRGGRSVNTIAPDASAELDIRSEDPNALATLDRIARRAIRAALEDHTTSDGAARPAGSAGNAAHAGVTLEIRRIGRRPAGSIAQADPLIEAILKARHDSHLPAPTFNAGSTDANHPTSLGIPAACIGPTTGAEAHTPREWINTAPIRDGLPYVGRAIANAARLPPLRGS
jgi:acetylornithine deacetylase/succinyl-diaminopimelate desuccinylase-like protein